MKLPVLLVLSAAFSAAACTPAQNDTADQPTQTAPGGKKGGGKKGGNPLQNPDLRQVGKMPKLVFESSGLCAAPQPGSYFTFGDDGQAPTVFRVDGSGQVLGQFEVGAPNHDWESMSRDNSGNYYLGDCGNNNSDRQNLAILRFRPETPAQVGVIKFRYPDQTEFPPKKKERNFDCEASLWHGGQVYLFTKDRATESTCKVYTVPETPGNYVAKQITKLAIPGQITDATLSPSGRRLVLLAREELFVLEGTSWEAILRATPRRIGLEGAGQTEGAAFKDEKTLLITTEKGAVYELGL